MSGVLGTDDWSDPTPTLLLLHRRLDPSVLPFTLTFTVTGLGGVRGDPSGGDCVKGRRVSLLGPTQTPRGRPTGTDGTEVGSGTLV